jgi:hypothetical protein
VPEDDAAMLSLTQSFKAWQRRIHQFRIGHGALGSVLEDVPALKINCAIDEAIKAQCYLCTRAQEPLVPDSREGRVRLTDREQMTLFQLAQR